MVKIERTKTPPASLAIQKQKPNGSYAQQDVIDQLFIDFHEKCYLCEQNELQSIEVEHLLPHHNGKELDRKFDWNNLFLSCSHCNSVKNRGKYETNVVNCCTDDPETLIHQELYEGKVCVTAVVDTPEAKTTASLVEDCFELRNQAIREKECQVKVRALQSTMNLLYKELNKYQIGKTERSLRTLRGMLNRKYKFSGFTRTYVRDNLEKYPELAPFVVL